MRKLILILAAGVFFAIAGLPALADSAPVTGTTTANAAVRTSVPGAANRRHLHWFAGSVSSVGASSLTLAVLWAGPNDGSLNGQTVTVAVTTSTKINQGRRHTPIALAAIESGDLVAIAADGQDASSLTAARIHVFCNCHWVGGVISSIGTDSFGIDVKRTGPYDTVLDGHTITMHVNADTVYLRGRHQARLGFADLKVGMGVGIVFAADGFFRSPGFDPATATYTAKKVHVWGKRHVPAPSTDASVSAGVAVS